MTHKVCTACRESKPFAAFSKDKKGDRNGLRAWCKPCRAARNTEWHRVNKTQSLTNHRKWLAENPDKVKAQALKWMRGNPVRHAEISRDWRRNNPARNAAKAARYRTRQFNAQPAWLTAIQKAQIEEFYEVAAALTVQTGVAHHVDHIYPLAGDSSCGLHVPWNLQVLTATENTSKKNRTVI